MRTRSLALSVLALAACGGGSSGPVQVQQAQTSIGAAVADPTGRLLYMFVDDMSGKSACVDGCADDWPPYVVDVAANDLAAGPGLTGTLSLFTRANGKTQLVYGGFPLYDWAGDVNAGDLRGQGIGGSWYVVGLDGSAITKDAPPPAWSGADTGKTLSLSSTKVGMAVADAKGRPLYMFVNDGPGVISCTEGCADDWPPYTASGVVTVGTGLDATKAGTITRGDGSTQVTYGGLPLYYWPGDWAPGDLRGQGIGSTWFVVGASGAPIM